MKKLSKIVLLLFVALFLFASCSQYSTYPWWIYDQNVDDCNGGGVVTGPTIDPSAAAVLTGSVIDEMDRDNIKIAATSLGLNYAFYALDAIKEANPTIYTQLLALVGDIMTGDVTVTDETLGLAKDAYALLMKDNLIETIIAPIAGDDDSMTISVVDASGMPTSEEFSNLIDAMAEASAGTTLRESFSATFALAAAKPTSRIFTDGSTMSYDGVFYIDVDFTVVNDERSDFYITIDRATCYTDPSAPLNVYFSADGEANKIGFADVSADFDAKIQLQKTTGDGGTTGSINLEMGSPWINPDTSKGTITFEGTEISFADAVAETAQGN